MNAEKMYKQKQNKEQKKIHYEKSQIYLSSERELL